MISAGSRSLSWSPVSGPDFLHRALLGRKVPVLSAMDQEIFSNIDKLRVYNKDDKFEDPLWVVAEKISDRVDFVDFISLLLDAYDSGHVDDAVEVINAVLGQSNSISAAGLIKMMEEAQKEDGIYPFLAINMYVRDADADEEVKQQKQQERKSSEDFWNVSVKHEGPLNMDAIKNFK